MHAADRYRGNITLKRRVDRLSASDRGGISPDAGDAEICHQAETTARDFVRRLAQVEKVTLARIWDKGVRCSGQAEVVARMQRFFARALFRARGLLDLWPCLAPDNLTGAVRRIQCAKWWRRTYRRLHARTVEACAIELGLVSQAAGLYASDDAVKRRAAQNARNAAVLASVNAVNDHFQAYTLADLAATGTANKTIRRVELLTRIAGFELIAKDLGHEAFMVTVSCPSRFHKCTTRGGRVTENPKYDDSTPADAQKYLSGQWARFRAAAAREGLGLYGFRIAEPQHDGTPHWHILLFVPDASVGKTGGLLPLVQRYFLANESPDEAGAAEHRVDLVRIDWEKGSAVGYVIKYISKNIDGHGVGFDLFGNDAVTSSQRVEAWASTWNIRQFQQIGGAPVTVWRELRRLHPENIAADAPRALSDCIVAINRQKTEPGVASIAWKKYIEAQGGIGCPRKNQPVKLLKEQTGEIGRYGEVMSKTSIGVMASGSLAFENHIHVLLPDHPKFIRPALAEVESERAAWLIAGGSPALALASAKRVFGLQRSEASTWIHVNNCTVPIQDAPSMFGLLKTYRRKLRRFRKFPGAEINQKVVKNVRPERSEEPRRAFAFSDAEAPW